MDFRTSLAALIATMDPAAHAVEIGRLKACKSVRDLERLANDAWLSTHTKDPRLKLVRHNSGTYLVVQYVDGWSSRIGQQDFVSR